MRILLSSENFDRLGGTETYTLTVAGQLDALGHEVSVYSPRRGEAARVAARRGIRVIGRAELPRSCELLLFGDAATCHELAPRYVDAARLFVMHSRDIALQCAPQLEGCCDAVIVLNDRVRRAVEASDWHPRIIRLRQPIETIRFRHLAMPRARPKRALVLSNRATGHRAVLIERACRASGIELVRVGSPTVPSDAPEHAIADVDLVIGTGRSALEGMAASRPVYVYDSIGGDGWVTPEQYPALEADGFAGLADRELTVDLPRLTEDIAHWDGAMGEANRDLVYAHHEAREHAIELVRLGRSLGSPQSRQRTAGDELARLVRLEWHASALSSSALEEAGRLRAELEHSRQEAAGLRVELKDAYTQLETFRASRRYRLACLLGRPIESLRELRRAPRA